MVTRYEIAATFKEHWPILNWKGDTHMIGVYFNQSYGYMIDRTYAVRMKHDEPVPSLFYVPAFDEEQEDEVVEDYPYKELKKKPNKYNYLFLGDSLEEDRLKTLFEVDTLCQFHFSRSQLLELTNLISKKRERDRALIQFEISGSSVLASLIIKGKVVSYAEKEIEKGCLKNKDVACIKANANVIFHALHLFSLSKCILFSISRDRIILTDETTNPKIEAVISLPKDTIDK